MSAAVRISSARAAAVLARHLDQPHGVGRVGGTHHQEQVGARGDRGHRPLAVGGGVADVLVARALDRREAPPQHRDDGGRVGHRERGLGRVGEPRRVGRPRPPRRRPRSRPAAPSPARPAPWCRSPRDGRHGRSAARCARPVVALDLAVHLGDQRTGGVGEQQPAPARLGRHSSWARHAPRTRPARPSGTSSSSSTNTAPSPRSSSTTWRLWTISWRT